MPSKKEPVDIEVAYLPRIESSKGPYYVRPAVQTGTLYVQWHPRAKLGHSAYLPAIQEPPCYSPAWIAREIIRVESRESLPPVKCRARPGIRLGETGDVVGVQVWMSLVDGRT